VPESGHPAFSRLSVLRTLGKRKGSIAIAWILWALAGGAVVRLLPAVYLAEAVVLIDTQKIPERFVSATVAGNLEDRIAAIRQTLLSGDELKAIIEEFGLYKEARKTRFEEEILDRMRKDISITLETVGTGANSKHTADFRIGYQGPDPRLAMSVANRLTDLCVERNMRTREGEAEGTSEFIDAQLGEAKKQLDTLEAAVSAYKLQHNGELPQQEQSLAGALSRLQTELEANRDAINRTQQTRVILEGNLTAVEATLAAQTRAWEQAQPAADGKDASSPVAEKKTSEALEEQLAVLRGRYSDEHPDVIRLQGDIAKVKAVEEQRKSAPAAGGGARSLPPAREPLEFEHTRQQAAGLKAQIQGSDKEMEDRKAEQGRILGDLDTYQHRMEKLPVREQEMAQVTRDYEMSKENYKSLLDKKMAAEMALDMEKRQQSERFTVVDRAELPEKPIRPNRPLLYGAVGILSLMLALVMGFGAELRQNVVLGEWELPAGTPVLARLPLIADTIRPPVDSPGGPRTLEFHLPPGSPLMPFAEWQRRPSEQYRILRTKISQHPQQPHLIAVSSPGSGDGKSVSAINTAGALSLKSEGKVLLLDANFRQPAIHRQLSLPESPGLAEVLGGACTVEDALVRARDFPNLFVLPAGAAVGNPGELLDSEAWQELCAKLRGLFRYVIVDSPPVGAVADYDLIQAVCDGVIVVVRPDHTDRRLCRKALENTPKGKFLGVLLNWVPD